MDFLAQTMAQRFGEPARYILQFILPLLPWFVGLVVILGVIRVVWITLRLSRRRSPRSPQSLPQVQLNNKFISYAEADFYRVLQQVVGDRGIILAQVALNRLLWFPGNNRSNPGRQTWWNKTAQKSVDFVVVDPRNLRPMVIIELNDSTHTREDRMTRDDDLKTILAAANIPLQFIPAAKSYDPLALAKLLQPFLP